MKLSRESGNWNEAPSVTARHKSVISLGFLGLRDAVLRLKNNVQERFLSNDTTDFPDEQRFLREIHTIAVDRASAESVAEQSADDPHSIYGRHLLNVVAELDMLRDDLTASKSGANT
ncbi:hypothetical protein KBD20_03015 [Candidatus Saccharibacteria bacterium]|nr:hypothetical protein [Candidatus Saccharibacteria bacterium]